MTQMFMLSDIYDVLDNGHLLDVQEILKEVCDVHVA
jgi:hypothetical protein